MFTESIDWIIMFQSTSVMGLSSSAQFTEHREAVIDYSALYTLVACHLWNSVRITRRCVCVPLTFKPKGECQKRKVVITEDYLVYKLRLVWNSPSRFLFTKQPICHKRKSIFFSNFGSEFKIEIFNFYVSKNEEESFCINWQGYSHQCCITF